MHKDILANIELNDSKTILYVGGFQLPDKNAAALRVLSNAKAMRKLGYEVIFVNALIESDKKKLQCVYYDRFKCIEYKREKQSEYLTSCKRIISLLRKTRAGILIAYNYPAIALNKLRNYCNKNNIKCIADVTEWYIPTGRLIFRLIKGFDSEYRMRFVLPRMDGVIAISEYLYIYYHDRVKTIKIPPLVDKDENKWKVNYPCWHDEVRFVYAGTPSAQKERLDLIVDIVENAKTEKIIQLNVIGVTEEQFNDMYNTTYRGNHVKFWGRVSNSQVIRIIMESDWSIILREKNKVVQAGFPTKVSETISCGIPIIANRFSNISDYLNDSNSILIEDIDSFDGRIIEKCINKRCFVDSMMFDYRNYIEEFKKLL